MAPQLLKFRSPADAPSGLDDGVFAGTVRAVTHRVVAVDHEGGSSLAKRAASCLIAPEVGDSVLCSAVKGAVFVLAVLERDGSEHVMEVDGDLCLRSRGGAVRMEAGQSAVTVEPESVRVASERVAVAAERGTWVGRELRLLGEHLSLSADRITQESELAERVAKSLKERLGRSYRDVEEEEHVRAGSLTYSVRHLLRAHAESAITTAKRLIKLDGGQIHLG